MSDASENDRNSIARLRGLALVGVAAIVAFGLWVGSDRPTLSGTPEPYALRVDPTTAPIGVLEALPRIGPTMASRIVDARDQGRFRDLDDFDARVKGVGPATRTGLTPYLVFPEVPNEPAR